MELETQQKTERDHQMISVSTQTLSPQEDETFLQNMNFDILLYDIPVQSVLVNGTQCPQQLSSLSNQILISSYQKIFDNLQQTVLTVQSKFVYTIRPPLSYIYICIRTSTPLTSIFAIHNFYCKGIIFLMIIFQVLTYKFFFSFF